MHVQRLVGNRATQRVLQRQPAGGGTGGAEEAPPPPIRTLRLLPPEPIDLRITGIGLTRPTMFLRGPTGSLYDLSPYTGNRALDLPLAALEALGIPILSYFHFHGGRAAALRGMHFRNVYALSGGTSFVRNAVFYGYISAENFDLYGAPASYSDHYDILPNLGIHANARDIGTMIRVDYFNNPLLPDRLNVPTIIFSLQAPFDHNPIEAIANLGAAIGLGLSGRLYTEPGVTHNYPDFWSRPEPGIGR